MSAVRVHLPGRDGSIELVQDSHRAPVVPGQPGQRTLTRPRGDAISAGSSLPGLRLAMCRGASMPIVTNATFIAIQKLANQEA